MKRIVWILCCLCLLATGCVKNLNFKNVQVDNWTPDWALPIMYANLNLQSFINPNTTITVDPTGLYTLHYTGQLFSVTAGQYIKIPNQSFSSPQFTLSNPVTSASFTGTISDSVSSSASFTDTNGARLDHVDVSSGTVSLNIVNTFNQNVSITVTFPGITKGGVPVSVNATITYPATSTSVNVDLSGDVIDLTNGGTTSNYLAYKLKYTLTGTGQPIAATNTIGATISLSNLNYTFIDGFLGRYNIPIPNDTIAIGVFDRNIIANIFLKNPSINLSFANSFGIGGTVALDSIVTVSTQNIYKYLELPGIPVVAAPATGTTASSVFTVDSSNSSIQYVFNPGPDKVIYHGAFELNAGVTSGYNFVYDTSTLSLVATANLPAVFQIFQFSVGDTAALTLPTDTAILQSAEFKLLTTNGIPLYGSVQFYFADTNYTILDSLIWPSSYVLQQAPVNTYGIVTSPSTLTTTFYMTHDRYNAMAPRVRHAIIIANMYSSGTSTVQILSSNYMNFKLACRFTLDVPSGQL